MKRYIYFSATGTTKRVMDALGSTSESSLDVTLATPLHDELSFGSSDLVYIGFPVYGGRVPAVTLQRLESLCGNGCKVVVVAVYGNRHYDDAIDEIRSFVEAHGCNVVAAIAAVAEHCIVPSIAQGRPDADDIAKLNEIGKEIDRRFIDGELITFDKQSKKSFKPYGGVPLHPRANSKCTKCGLCVTNCPVGAINNDNPRKTDKTKCITCMRCVNICPKHARKLPFLLSLIAGHKLKGLCKERRDIEVFWK